MNIFIEGLPGSGKTTIVTKFSKVFSDYHVFREEDIPPGRIRRNFFFRISPDYFPKICCVGWKKKYI